MSIISVKVSPVNNKSSPEITPDKLISDDLLKYKLRDLNLIMYNPNLFTNREKGNFYELMGGNRTAATILTCALLGVFYRKRANVLRGIPYRIGVWNMNIHFWMGAAFGLFYSSIFFVNSQQLLNDYFAQFLLKRYPSCVNLDRKNIWRYKDIPNDDENYHYTSTFMNHAHL
jgi:hypothetical protein